MNESDRAAGAPERAETENAGTWNSREAVVGRARRWLETYRAGKRDPLAEDSAERCIIGDLLRFAAPSDTYSAPPRPAPQAETGTYIVSAGAPFAGVVIAQDCLSPRPSPAPREEPQIVEALAALAHEQWTGWMRHLFSKAKSRPEAEGFGVRIPAEWAERWMRQMNTPYAELTETEKESDRKEARRVLAVLGSAGAAPPVPQQAGISVVVDLFRQRLNALAEQWRDPGFWGQKGCEMDSRDCALELQAILGESTDTSTLPASPALDPQE